MYVVHSWVIEVLDGRKYNICCDILTTQIPSLHIDNNSSEISDLSRFNALTAMATLVASLFSPVASTIGGVAAWLPLRRWSRKTSKRDGGFRLSIFHPEPNAQVDVVLVHGLGTNSKEAWTDGLGRNAYCWPVVELGKNARLPSRVIAYDYDSTVWSAESVTDRTLLHQSGILIQRLSELRSRENANKRSIVLCATAWAGSW